MVACDDNVETLLPSVRQRVSQHPAHLVEASFRDEMAREPALVPIEVLSATPGWIELLIPCDLEVAARVSDLFEQFQSNLPEDTGAQIGQAFRELLMNAVE